jgi:hypothetical protein
LSFFQHRHFGNIKKFFKKNQWDFQHVTCYTPRCTTKVQLEVWLVSTTKLSYVLGIEATYLAYLLTSNLSTYYLRSYLLMYQDLESTCQINKLIKVITIEWNGPLFKELAYFCEGEQFNSYGAYLPHMTRRLL